MGFYNHIHGVIISGAKRCEKSALLRQIASQIPVPERMIPAISVWRWTFHFLFYKRECLLKRGMLMAYVVISEQEAHLPIIFPVRTITIRFISK